MEQIHGIVLQNFFKYYQLHLNMPDEESNTVENMLNAMKGYINSGETELKQRVEIHRLKFPNENLAFYSNLETQRIGRDSNIMSQIMYYVIQQKARNVKPIFTHEELVKLYGLVDRLKMNSKDIYRNQMTQQVLDDILLLQGMAGKKKTINIGEGWKRIGDNMWVFEDPEYPITIERKIRNGSEVFFQTVEDKANHKVYPNTTAYKDVTLAKLSAIERIRQLKAVSSTKRSVYENADILLNYIAQHQPVPVGDIILQWNPALQMDISAATDAFQLLVQRSKIRHTPNGYVINQPESVAKPPERNPAFYGRQGKLF